MLKLQMERMQPLFKGSMVIGMMKTLNEYMAMSYRMEIVEDKDEGGYVVSFPDLPGCLTCGETIESAVDNAMDAKKAYLLSKNDIVYVGK